MVSIGCGIAAIGAVLVLWGDRSISRAKAAQTSEASDPVDKLGTGAAERLGSAYAAADEAAAEQTGGTTGGTVAI